MRFTPHTIVPSEFEYLDSYDLGNAEDKPFNIGNATRLVEESPVENFECLSKCCVCGTPFRYGDVWRHLPSGVRIVIGHRCAAKYGLMASRGQYKHMRAAEVRKRERRDERRRVRIDMKKFLRMHRELPQQLRFDHPFVKKIRATLIRWGTLSVPQMQAVTKVIRDTETHRKADVDLGPPVPVKVGRYEIYGTIVSLKFKENEFGPVLKMLVRVVGWYKVWGTCPDALSDAIWAQSQRDKHFEGGIIEWVRMHPVRVRFTATVTQSDDDESFGFFKRPTKAEVLL